jgi:CMP/dCMP kinase
MTPPPSPSSERPVKKGFVVAVDGPAGTGKSSVTRRLASELGFIHIDTGALYRAIALQALGQGLNPENASDHENISKVAVDAQIEFKQIPGKNPSNRVFLNGDDVTGKIRTAEVGMAASKVSAIPAVRNALFGLQRELGSRQNSILEGRDIGTVIFPDADLKLFLSANIEERVKRRLAELEILGVDVPSYEDLLAQIAARDAGDSNRSIAPLKKADDAIEIDTSDLTLEEVVIYIKELIASRMEARNG